MICRGTLRTSDNIRNEHVLLAQLVSGCRVPNILKDVLNDRFLAGIILFCYKQFICYEIANLNLNCALWFCMLYCLSREFNN